MLVKEILRVKGGALYTTTPEQNLEAVVAAMADLDVGSLVVMEAGKMAGMLTFREVLVALKQQGLCPSDGLKVRDVMLKNPVTVFPEMEANDLRRLMIEKRSRYMPVMNGEELMGVISFLDVAKAVLDEQGFENQMLKSYIKNWPDEPQI